MEINIKRCFVPEIINKEIMIVEMNHKKIFACGDQQYENPFCEDHDILIVDITHKIILIVEINNEEILIVEINTKGILVVEINNKGILVDEDNSSQPEPSQNPGEGILLFYKQQICICMFKHVIS